MGQVSHRLVQAMYHADITQEELAKRMYVSQKTVGSWMKERNLPRADSFIMLCKILNVDPEWLLTGEGGESRMDIVDSLARACLEAVRKEYYKEEKTNEDHSNVRQSGGVPGVCERKETAHS